MAKITIEQDGEVKTYIGTITRLYAAPDFMKMATINGGEKHVRDGSGEVSLDIRYINGPQDEVTL